MFWQPTWISALPLHASVMLAMMLQVAFLVFSNLLSRPPTCLVKKSTEIPRRCGRQTQRSNHPAEDAVDWRRAVFIPFADQLISELNGRFNQLATTAASGLQLLPENVVKPDSRLDQVIGGLQEAFCTDLPAPQSFPQEVQRWVKKWKAVSPGALPKSLSATALATNSGSYPNISCLLHLRQMMVLHPKQCSTFGAGNTQWWNAF